MSDDEPGDAVCWLPQLCPECGAMPTGEHPERCWRCGAALGDKSVEDAPRPP
jgi:ribosomal protein S27AE